MNSIHSTEIDGTLADYYAKGGELVIDDRNIDVFRSGFLGVGGFYVRPFDIKAGDRKKGHEHYINHLGLLLSGQARVHWRSPDGARSGTVELRKAWASMHIRADYWHEIEAVTDVQWACLFAKSEADRVYGDAADVRWTMEKNSPI